MSSAFRRLAACFEARQPAVPAAVLTLLLLFLVSACTTADPAEAPTAAPTTQASQAVQSSATATPIAGGQPDATMVGGDTVRELTILYTNDEHGWMEGMEPGQGAANLLGLWRQVEGYSEDGSFLIISGGDMWTGPAISTWFDGQSMVEAMNAMGYAAAAVGNHEFDFGLDALSRRAAEANFPFLSANIRYKSDGSGPTDLGIEPYTIVAVDDVQVGIVGLTTTETPQVTNPVNVAGFDFVDYEAALREVLPQARAAGADIVVVATHVCRHELVPLANQIGDMDIQMIGGGHCNELFAEEVNGIVILEGGFHLTSYARATFLYDQSLKTVVGAEYGVSFNSGGNADALVEELVTQWGEEAAAELDQVIGHTAAGIGQWSVEMEDLITESWLAGYPSADLAVTNLGGMRAALQPGDITLADVVGVMPFDNVLIELHLTGRETLHLLSHGKLAVGGAHSFGPEWILDGAGEAIEADQLYTVLVNDFMYAGGDDFGFLADYDAEGYNTAIDWRQPVIDWIVEQRSTAMDPLDDALSALGR